MDATLAREIGEAQAATATLIAEMAVNAEKVGEAVNEAPAGRQVISLPDKSSPVLLQVNPPDKPLISSIASQYIFFSHARRKA